MGLEEDLNKKDIKELKELILKQQDEIDSMKQDAKSKDSRRKSKDLSETASQVNAFDLNLIGTVGSMFQSSADAFMNTINLFDTEIFETLDEDASTLQRSFGLSKARISEFRNAIAETTPELMKMGYEEAETVDVIEKAMKGLGTAASLGSQTIIELGATAKITGEDVNNLAANFREVGISVTEVGEEMKSVVDYARSVGVSVEAVSGLVSKNLKQMNLFNFENGVQGLAKMAAQATRLGVDMGKIFDIAEGLMSPEKAIDMSAALQRLGVTSGALLDPLRAMDLAQNDPEQLQKEMVNLSKEFTTFNEKTGKMEILPGAKRRLREVAKEIGLNADEFAKMSIQSADFERKLKQIRMPSLAEGDEETKELIASMAQLDAGGVATIQVKDADTGFITEKKVEELTPDDIENLKKANEESSKSIEEIAINQLSETKQIRTLLDSGKVAGNLARATAPTLEKMAYFVAGTSKSIAQRYRDELGDVKGIREKIEGVARPVEDFVYGSIKGDGSIVSQAVLDFSSGFQDVTKSFFAGADNFVKEITNDAIQRIEKTYGRENQTKSEVVYKHEGTIVLKGEGDARGQTNMDLTNPEVQVGLQKAVAGGNSPSATVGRKN